MHRNGTRLVHQALLYETEEEFVGTVVPFLREGLGNGDRVIAVTTPARLALIEEALGRDASFVEFLNMQEVYDVPARQLATMHEYLQDPERLRVMGEPHWSGSEREREERARFEALINVVFASADAELLCPYNVRLLDSRILEAAVKTHPLLGYGEDRRPSASYVDPAMFSAACDAAPLPEPEGSTEMLAFRAEHDLRAVRGFVKTYAGRANLTDDQVESLLVATNEVATNALRHGGGRGTVRCWLEPGQLACEITDPFGRITDPLAGYVPPAPDQLDGRGLWLVRQLCDGVEIRSGQQGTVVRLQFRAANLRPALRLRAEQVP
jgi:anti-sigma regulatory factor (Ser/Thr protein kinase)